MGRRSGRIARRRIACAIAMLALAPPLPAWADGRREACKAAMNDRIQTCTNDCTARALAAVPDYKDTNNNVKFGCMKGCAIGQIMQMRACAEGKDDAPADPVETNRH